MLSFSLDFLTRCFFCQMKKGLKCENKRQPGPGLIRVTMCMRLNALMNGSSVCDIEGHHLSRFCATWSKITYLVMWWTDWRVLLEGFNLFRFYLFFFSKISTKCQRWTISSHNCARGSDKWPTDAGSIVNWVQARLWRQEWLDTNHAHEKRKFNKD